MSVKVAEMAPSSFDSTSQEKLLAQQKLVFEKFASVEKNGQKYMSPDDFIVAIAPGEDYKKIQKEHFAMLFRVADAEHKGLVSFQDFVVFENLISKPDAEYEIAFRLFDVDGTGKITFDQFKKVFSKYLGPESVPFDYDCDWLKLFVGSGDKRHDLAYEEFSQLLRGIQGERLRQEFEHYDTKKTGYITPDSFKKIILSIAKHKLSDFLIDQLPTLCNVSAGNKINYASVLAFHNVIRQMDMVERIVTKAIAESSDRRITKSDFLNAAAQSTRFSLFTPLEADIIFHFAGLGNPSGRLGLQDFEKLLDAKWSRPRVRPVVKVLAKERTGVLWEILHQAYAFVLGSIAGSVGATVVYPIDLVKTRLQNQRSKIVGELLYKNSIDCFQKVIKNEGILGLYSGLTPQLVGVAPEKAIKLTVNDFVRAWAMDKETGQISLGAEIFAGSAAGGCQVVFTNPLEIVKIRLQVYGLSEKVNAEPKKSALRIVRSLGILGLYKGVSACLLRDIPFSAIYFPSYAHLKKDFFGEGPEKKLSILELLAAGAIAGMPAAYLTTPADVIKTRLQVEEQQGQTSYKGVLDAARKIYVNEGLRAFLKGGPARVFRSSPQFGTTLMVYESLKRMLPWDATEERVDTVVDTGGDLGYLRSRNALKVLLDLDYKFGVVPTALAIPTSI